ncbi:MAG TPA: ABC transporter permease [Gammaproteobacteria bacterium]|nr:ABC transporter permease [Gammaproteobacteria bacterium]
MGVLFQELKQALRRLLRQWGFTLTFVLTLALAIGANGGVFAALYAYLVQPLPYPGADRLVMVQSRSRQMGWTSPAPDLHDAHAADILSSGRYTPGSVTAMIAGKATSVHAGAATPGLFATLDVRPFAGRLPSAHAGEPGGPREVVLSYAFWQQAFGGDKKALSQVLQVDGLDYDIVGIMPRGFYFPTRDYVFWTSLDSKPNDAHGAMLARLAPAAKMEHAQLALDTALQRDLADTAPAYKKMDWHINVTPLRAWLGHDNGSVLLLMQGGALALLLLAAFNLGNLALVRAIRRRHEMALRLALGARRASLLRLAVMEALPLALATAMAGLLLARYAAAGLNAFGFASAATGFRIVFSANVVAAIAGLSLVVSLAAMVAPLLIVRRDRLAILLKQGTAQSGGSSAALHLRRMLSTLQIALAVLLLSASILIGLSLRAIVHHDHGFAENHLVVANLSLSGAAYDSKEQRQHAWHELQNAAAELPGVESAGIGIGVPFAGTAVLMTFTPDASAPKHLVTMFQMLGGKGLLNTLQVRLLAGRLFQPADFNSDKVAVVDKRFARTMFGTTDVVGRYVDDGEVRIVGLINNINEPFHRRGRTNGTIVRPVKSGNNKWLTLVLRSPLGPGVISDELRAMLGHLMPDQSFIKIGTMEQYISSSAQDTSALAALLIACGTIALALASIGTYGVIAQLGRARRREFAVRVALGARPGQIEGLVLRSGLVLWAIGSLAGVGLAIWMGLLFSDRLYKVSLFDPAPYVTAAGVIGVIVLLASWLPARSARRLDLSDALSGE